MGQQHGNRKVARSVKMLLVGGSMTILAFIIGFACASPDRGFGQPALLWLAAPAAAFGVVARRLYLGALFSLLFALAGAIGLLLRRAALDSNWPVVLGVFFGLGGLVCVVAGAFGGLIGDLLHRPMQRP